MNTTTGYFLIISGLLIAPGLAVRALSQEPTKPASSSAVPESVRVSTTEARRQAELLHSAMHTTLHFVHHRLYRDDEGLPLPASVMDDVFEEIESEKNIQLRWLAIEGQAMNTDHIPQDEFELSAAKALKAGKNSHERIEGGVFRWVGPITLSNQCLKCHVPDRKSTEDRIAGLVINIPVLAVASDVAQ